MGLYIVELTDNKLNAVVKEYFTLTTASTVVQIASSDVATYLMPNFYEHCVTRTAQLEMGRKALQRRLIPVIKKHLEKYK